MEFFPVLSSLLLQSCWFGSSMIIAGYADSFPFHNSPNSIRNTFFLGLSGSTETTPWLCAVHTVLISLISFRAMFFLRWPRSLSSASLYKELRQTPFSIRWPFGSTHRVVCRFAVSHHRTGFIASSSSVWYPVPDSKQPENLCLWKKNTTWLLRVLVVLSVRCGLSLLILLKSLVYALKLT